MNSRRNFLKDASVAVTVAIATRPLLGWAANQASKQSAPIVPGADGMIIRSLRFLDLEMPPEYANSWLTPVPHFYVRNHMFEPAKVDAAEWKVTIGGEVQQPLTLGLNDLTRLDQHSVTNTLECAGNGRAFQNPKVAGMPMAAWRGRQRSFLRAAPC